MTTAIQRYHAAADRMNALIVMNPSPTDKSREAMNMRAIQRMERMEEFLAAIGNPHTAKPSVHLAGTSGKGSTSTAIAAMLTAAGYRTGLHVSPYLQVQTEKLQVDGELVSIEMFVDLVDEFFAAHDTWVADGNDSLTYYEASTVLMWLFFRARDVDICVVEAGVGGRFDLTNIIRPALCVITSVGLDHTGLLGDTIEEIAWNKAGIIKHGVPVVSSVPDPVAQAVIRHEVDLVGAPLLQLDLDREITDVVTSAEGTSWQEHDTGMFHRTGLAGSFQARNGQLAVRAMRVLREHGFAISDEAIEAGLACARIPGRAELIHDRVSVIMDGAHNPEKIAAFAQDISALAPVPDGRRIMVVGVLESKQDEQMLAQLVPYMDVLVATCPQVIAKDPTTAEDIAAHARAAGFAGDIYLEPNPQQAIEQALAIATGGKDAVIVTGSLYLVGNIRERWYSAEAITAAQSSWP